MYIYVNESSIKKTEYIQSGSTKVFNGNVSVQCDEIL